MAESKLCLGFSLVDQSASSKWPGEAMLAFVDDEIVSLEDVYDFVRREYGMEDFAIFAEGKELQDDQAVREIVNKALECEVTLVLLEVHPLQGDWELVDNASQFTAESLSKETESDLPPQLPEPSQDKADSELQNAISGSESDTNVVADESKTVEQLESEDEMPRDENEQDVEPKPAVSADVEENPEECAQAPEDRVVSPEKSPEPKTTETTELPEPKMPLSQDYFVDQSQEYGMQGFLEDVQSSGQSFSITSFSLPSNLEGSSLGTKQKSMTPSVLEAQSFGTKEENTAFTKHEELVETLCKLAQKALDDHPEVTLKELETLVQSAVPSAPVIKLASDQEVVDSVLKTLSSSAVSNLIVDLARNEADSAEAFREILKSHLGELFAKFGELLHEHPGLITLIPELLRGLTTILEHPNNRLRSDNDGADEDEQKPIHYGVLCDGCDSEERKEVSIAQGNNYGEHIRGIRYKSAIKVNFDLCETCEASGVFDEEFAPFLKIKVPEKAPRDIICVLKERTNVPASEPENVSSVPERENPSSAGSTTIAEARPMRLTCPRNEEHQLMEFTVPNRLYACDICNTRPQRGETMYGCRICDWDVCSKCSVNEFRQLPLNEETSNSNKVQMKILPRAKFVTDINYQDCSLVQPGSKFIKIWRMKNSSDTVTWPPGCRLICVGGHPMGSPPGGKLVPPLPPGQLGDVSADMIAPTKPGRYIGYWRLVTPDNHQFGQRFWIDITVPDNFGGTAPPPAVPVQNDEHTQKWCKELQHLADMDFLDCEYNIKLLDKYDGKLDAVISTLLNEDQ